jgi:TonB family protein
MIARTLLVAFLLANQGRPVDPVTELAAVRNLYSAASFEDALARLTRIGPASSLQDEIDTYRALCLLALNRTPEAETVVEQILHRNPRYLPDETEVSPRLVTVFRTVRARLLPSIAKDLYASARSSFDGGRYDAASTQLHDLLAVIGGATDPAVADMKLLAEGFLKLTEAARAGVPISGSPMPTPAEPKPPIFSFADRGVWGPVEILRTVPQRASPKGTQPAIYQGLIEVVINERGRVESATMRRSIDPTFDAQLVAATAAWRFQPATRDGQPVKYRRSYEIIGYSR